MFTVRGKLSNKSLVKSGVSERGTWQIIQFLIEKTKNKKPIFIPVIAKGKLADKIDETPIGEKIKVEFYIEGKPYNGKYFTDCIATSIEKYVPKKKWIHGQVTFGNEVFDDTSLHLEKELHLFKAEQKEQ